MTSTELETRLLKTPSLSFLDALNRLYLLGEIQNQKAPVKWFCGDAESEKPKANK